MKHRNLFRASALEGAAAMVAILGGGVCVFGQDRANPATQAVGNRGDELASCGSAAFVTFEHGKVAAVNWVERAGNRIHTRAVQTQSQIVDASINVLGHQTAVHSSVAVSTAGAARAHR